MRKAIGKTIAILLCFLMIISSATGIPIYAEGDSTLTTITKTFSEDTGFNSVTLSIISASGGYSIESDNKKVEFNISGQVSDQLYNDYLKYIDDEHMPSTSASGSDADILEQQKEWLAANNKPGYEVKIQLTDPNGEKDIFKAIDHNDPSYADQCKIRVNGDNGEIAGYFDLDEYGLLTIHLDPIACHYDWTELSKSIQLELNEKHLTSERKEVVFNTKDYVVLQAFGTLKHQQEEDQKPDFTITKSAPANVTGTTIDYVIDLNSKESTHLNGKTLKDIIPAGLKIQSSKVTYNPTFNNDGTITGGTVGNKTVGDDGELKFPEDTEINSARVELTMTLSDEEYQSYITNGSIDKTFKNSAKLYGDDTTTPVASSNVVETKMNCHFIAKEGHASNVYGTKYAWTVDLNTQLPYMEYGYFVDSVCSTYHMYNFNDGVDVIVDGETYHISNFEKLNSNTVWTSLTAENIKKDLEKDLVSNSTFNNTAYYYYVERDNTTDPFDSTQKIKDVILIIPYLGLQGTNQSKDVEIKYNTDLNMHGMDSQQYWNTVDSLNNPPKIENVANLLWHNVNGTGPGPHIQESVNMNKNVIDYPGTIVKKGKNYDQSTQTVTWEILVNQLGIHMDNVVIKDDLTGYDITTVEVTQKQHIETEGGIEENDLAITPTYDGNEMSLNLGNISSDDMRIITIKAKLQDGTLLANQDLGKSDTTQNTANTATVDYEVGGTPLHYVTSANIDVPNTLIKKGAPRINGTDEEYDEENHDLEWSITVNPNNLPIKGAIVTDTLPEGFIYEELEGLVRVEKNGTEMTDGVPTPTYDNTSKTLTFDLGDINDTYTIYFKTKATDTWIDTHLKSNQNNEVVNNVKLDGTIYENNITNANASATHNVKVNPILKSGEYHPDLGTIDWTIVVNAQGYNLQNLRFEETLNLDAEGNPTGKRVHILDADSIEIRNSDGTLATDVSPSDMTEEHFEVDFGTVSKNRNKYIITFTTILDDDAFNATITNVVYLIDPSGNRVVISNVSDGGYDGHFRIGDNSVALPRPNLIIKKISSNSRTHDATSTDNNSLGLGGAKINLKAYTFNYNSDDKTITITKKDAMPQYDRTRTSSEDGDTSFVALKASDNGNRLIYVLEEETSPVGYQRDKTPRFIIFNKSEEYEATKIVYNDKTYGDGVNKLYYYEETPNKAEGTNDIKWFTLKDGFDNEPIEHSFTITKQKLNWTSYFTDHTYSNAAGVEFSIKQDGRDSNNQQTRIPNVRSNANGQIVIANLDPGTYLLTEVSAPTGMEPGTVKLIVKCTRNKDTGEDTYSYQLTDPTGGLSIPTNSTGTITNDPLKTNVSFTKNIKYNDGTNDEIVSNNQETQAGVVFNLYSNGPSAETGNAGMPQKKDEDNNDVAIATATSASNGVVTFSDLPVGNYTVKELQTNGYTTAETTVYQFRITDNNGALTTTWLPVTNYSNSDNPAKVYDTPIKGTLAFTKQRIATNLSGFTANLAGAQFGLYRKIGKSTASQPLYTATSSSTGEVKFENVEYGDYVLKEITTPTGYVNASNITITRNQLVVSENHQTFTYTPMQQVNNADVERPIDNKIVEQSLTLKKVDEDGNTKSGIIFDIYRRGAEVLADGTNMVTVVDTNVNSYGNYNPCAIETTDSTGTATTLSGKVKTDANGKITLNNLPYGDYILKETNGVNLKTDKEYVAIYINVSSSGVTVKEYEGSTDIDVSTIGIPTGDSWQAISKSGDTYTIKNHYKYGFIDLKKIAAYDATNNGSPIKGAKFNIYKKDDTNVYVTVETDANGNIIKNSDGAYGTGNNKKHLWYGEYTIKEVSAPAGYSVYDTPIDFIVGDSTTGDQGTTWISYDLTSSSVVYKKQGETLPTTTFKDTIVPLEYSVTGTKNLTGHSLIQFEFGLYDKSGTDGSLMTGNGIVVNSGQTVNKVKNNTTNGQFSFNFKFDAEMLKKSDGTYSTKTYTYYVKETNDNSSGYTYDTNVHTLVITVGVRDNDKTKKPELYATHTIDGSNQALTFTNSYNATGSVILSANKVLAGNRNKKIQAGEFTFKVKRIGEYVTETSGTTYTPMTDQTDYSKDVVAASDTDPLKTTATFDEISYNQNDAGHTYVYEIQEKIPTNQGVIEYSTDKHYAKVTVTDNHDGTISTSVLYYNSFSAGTLSNPCVQNSKNVPPTFTNTYKASGNATLSGTKELTHGNIGEYNEKFSFKLYQETVTNDVKTKQLLQTKKNNVTGHFEFDALDYTQADIGKTYTYYVEEVRPDTATNDTNYTANAMKYDTKSYKVEVSISDNESSNGQLNVDVKLVNSDGTKTALSNSSQIKFTNDYTATGTAKVKGLKITNDHAMETFNYSIYSDQECTTKMADQSDTNNASAIVKNKTVSNNQKDSSNNLIGDFEFEFNYDMDDLKNSDGSYATDANGKTFTYYIKEDTDDRSYAFDTRIYKVEHQVTVDKTNGQLDVRQTITILNTNQVLVSQTIIDWDNATSNPIKIENQYQAKGQNALQAKKVLLGTRYQQGFEENEFTFTAKRVGEINSSGFVSMTNQPTIKGAVKTDGTVKFEDMNYDQEDIDRTYVYEIQENIPNETGDIDYSNETYYAKVDIIDNQTKNDEHTSQLSQTITYYTDKLCENGIDGIPTFTNRNVILTLKKQDANDESVESQKLSGATFKVTNKDDVNDTFEVTTDETGTVKIVNELTLGATYVVHETVAPVGYKIDAPDVTFTLNEDTGLIEVDGDTNAENTIVMKDHKTYFSFNKVGLLNEQCVDEQSSIDFDETKPLKDVEFEIYKADDLENVVTTVTSDEDGLVEVYGLPLGDYVIKETKTNNGYVLDEKPYYISITSDKEFEGIKDQDGQLLEDNTLINDIVRTDIKLHKVNEHDETQGVDGATYKLYRKGDDKDEYVASATTDEEGNLVFEGVCMDTQYVIKETKAAKGFYLSKDVFEIEYQQDEGVVSVKEVKNNETATYDEEEQEIIWKEPIVEVHVSKLDESQKQLKGAVLQIVDEDGKEIIKWTSGEEKEIIEGMLEVGKTYTLVEVQAPSGYLKADPIEFTIPNEAVDYDHDAIVVTMIDKAEPKKVSTGDQTPIETYAILSGVSLTCLSSLLFYDKKRKKKELHK